MAFVELKNVQKVYKTGEVETKALVGVDFEVEKGKMDDVFLKVTGKQLQGGDANA